MNQLSEDVLLSPHGVKTAIEVEVHTHSKCTHSLRNKKDPCPSRNALSAQWTNTRCSQPIVEEKAPACVLAWIAPCPFPIRSPCSPKTPSFSDGHGACLQSDSIFQRYERRGKKKSAECEWGQISRNPPRCAYTSRLLVNELGELPSSSFFLHSLHTCLPCSPRRQTSAALRLMTAGADLGMSTSPLCAAWRSIKAALLLERLRCLFSLLEGLMCVVMSASMYILP